MRFSVLMFLEVAFLQLGFLNQAAVNVNHLVIVVLILVSLRRGKEPGGFGVLFLNLLLFRGRAVLFLLQPLLVGLNQILVHHGVHREVDEETDQREQQEYQEGDKQENHKPIEWNHVEQVQKAAQNQSD